MTESVSAIIKINGIVQGVGFRPFIYRCAMEFKLPGWIRNSKNGVEIKLEGKKQVIENMITTILEKKPRLAVIEEIETEYSETIEGLNAFQIIKSDGEGKVTTWISPDTAICDDCLREMRDPADRRYRYPFINCTNCGPRFTIIKDVPYDRASTTMASFKMCPECQDEYSDPSTRRYHAQPDACANCGPSLTFTDENGETQDDALGKAISALKSGKIVAVKGLGGFHLAALADNEEIAKRLRCQKHRDEKPFAIMCKDTETAERFAIVSSEEKKILESFRRPIVLLKKHNKADYRWLSENGNIGIMLPYTPLHYLLFENGIDALIMTSANISDFPIMFKNEEALCKLKGVADAFLMHNRDIETRCDDSLLWVVDGQEYPSRRSRGYVPYPLRIKLKNTNEKDIDGILALGAEQKASFTLTRGDLAFPSQHIGDLKNLETFENYANQIKHFKHLFDIEVKRIVCDMHPDYMSATFGEDLSETGNLPLTKVQHHHAHMASCMADNFLTEKCIGIIWDGTGYGTDGTIWGGEFLIGDLNDFERAGSIRPVKLAGGDLAVDEIWRVGIALLEDAGISSKEMFAGENADKVRGMLQADINCPLSSGMGRLFDGVSAILGIKSVASYEGQGAILLETVAGESDGIYSYEIIDENGILRFDSRPMIRQIYAEKAKDRSVSLIAADFMNTLTRAAVDMCLKIQEKCGLNDVVLSGGTFQNMYLLKCLTKALKVNKFNVHRHCRVSTNDEGISFGQAAIAAAREERKNVSCSTT